MSLQSCVDKVITDYPINYRLSESAVSILENGGVFSRLSDISVEKLNAPILNWIVLEIKDLAPTINGSVVYRYSEVVVEGSVVVSTGERGWGYFRKETLSAICERAAPPTTTPDAGEDPPESLEEEPAPRVDEPCSPDADSNAPAQASGAIPSWGVNFEYLDASQTKQRWTLALLPAMQSNIRYTGGTDVPGALPGLSFRTIPSIARHKVPGFQPMYQHMGIDSVTVTMVGCFTGADGVEETLRPKFDNTNVVLLGSGGGDRRALIRQLDSYKSFQDFYRISVQQGRELTVELNLSGKFSAAEDTLGCTGLRNTRGNPQFKALVKRIDTYYARSDRTWYTLDLEITDYKLISDAPINLLPPEESSTDVLGTGDFTDSQSNSPVLSTPGREYRGQYYLWNEQVKANSQRRYEEVKTANNDVVFEYEVSNLVIDELTKAGLQDYPADTAQAVRGCDLGRSKLLLDVKKINEDRAASDTLVEYPCEILGRRGFLGAGNRGPDAARIIYAEAAGAPWGPNVYGLFRHDIRTPEGSTAKYRVDLITSIVGCATATVLAFATAIGGGLITVFSVGIGTPAGIALSAAAITIAVASCGPLLEDLFNLYNIRSEGLSKEEQAAALAQSISQAGESRTWFWIVVRAAMEVIPVDALFFPFKGQVMPVIRFLLGNPISEWVIKRLSDFPLVGRFIRSIDNFFRNTEAARRIAALVPRAGDLDSAAVTDIFRTLDPQEVSKIETFIQNLSDLNTPEGDRKIISFLNKLKRKLKDTDGDFTAQELDAIFQEVDPTISFTPSGSLPTTTSATPTTSSVPSSVFNPTEIQKLEDFITTRFPNDPDLMEVRINTNSETVIINSTNLNDLNSALNALEAGDEIDFIYPDGYSGFPALEIAVENLGLQYIEAGRFEVPNRATSPSAASSSPNVSTTGSASSTTTAPSNPSSPPTTSQAPEPTPRQASVNTPLVRGIPNLTGAEIDAIESALRAEADKLVVPLLGENNEIRDLSSIGRFIYDLRTRNLPDLGYWDFTYLRGQRPSREFINLVRSSGLQVEETRGPGLFRFQRLIQIYPYINPTSPRS